MQRLRVPTELPFLRATVAGWEGREATGGENFGEKKKKKKSFFRHERFFFFVPWTGNRKFLPRPLCVTTRPNSFYPLRPPQKSLSLFSSGRLPLGNFWVSTYRGRKKKEKQNVRNKTKKSQQNASNLFFTSGTHSSFPTSRHRSWNAKLLLLLLFFFFFFLWRQSLI